MATWKLILGVALGLDILASFLYRVIKGRQIIGKHVVITGGSSGIGAALAAEFLRSGAGSISLIARRMDVLQQTKTDLEALAAQMASQEKKNKAKKPSSLSSSSVRVEVASADATDGASLARAIQSLEEKSGPTDILVACAGSAKPGFFHEQDVGVFQSTMTLNYMGCVNAVKAVASGFLSRGSGLVVLVSSTMGLVGFCGYTSYAPTKWAVRGLADCLRNEWAGSGVDVCIAYPVDTDTPGFHEENRTKPPACAAISNLGNLYSAEKTAQVIVGGIKRGAYHLATPDVGVNLLMGLQAGISPHTFGPVSGVIIAAVGSLVLRGLRVLMDTVVKHYAKKKVTVVKKDT